MERENVVLHCCTIASYKVFLFFWSLGASSFNPFVFSEGCQSHEETTAPHTSQPSFRFTDGVETQVIMGWLESWHQNLSHPCQHGCLLLQQDCFNWTDFHMPYLAGAVVECVAVDGASLPVLDLYEAGAFGGAAVLQRLSGWGPALGRRLERAHRRLHMSHYFMPLCHVWLIVSDLWDTFGASWISCLWLGVILRKAEKRRSPPTAGKWIWEPQLDIDRQV